MKPTRAMAFVAVAMTTVAACAAPSVDAESSTVTQPPERFTIVPDDYHVPYAGTAEDGRRFFLSDELFSHSGSDGGTSYVGLFLWNADGTFDELRVESATRPDDVPPGQAAPAEADGVVEAMLAGLGDYVLEPITVEPFTEEVGGVVFGWEVDRYDDGTYVVTIAPGDFIAYNPPFDGLEYDTQVSRCIRARGTGRVGSADGTRLVPGFAQVGGEHTIDYWPQGGRIDACRPPPAARVPTPRSSRCGCCMTSGCGWRSPSWWRS